MSVSRLPTATNLSKTAQSSDMLEFPISHTYKKKKPDVKKLGLSKLAR